MVLSADTFSLYANSTATFTIRRTLAEEGGEADVLEFDQMFDKIENSKSKITEKYLGSSEQLYGKILSIDETGNLFLDIVDPDNL